MLATPEKQCDMKYEHLLIVIKLLKMFTNYVVLLILAKSRRETVPSHDMHNLS